MSPLTGVPIYFPFFPGVLPLQGATAGLLYAAPLARGSKIPLANASHLLDKLLFNIHTVLCILIMPTREIGYKLTNRLHIERARIEKMLRERIFDLPNGGRWCENKGLIIFPVRPL